MEKSNPLYASYLEILRRELVPAMGCTEPIAIAFAAAKAREVLGALPEAITVTASGNIIKNVKSVIVPNTEGRKGIEVAAAAGAFLGDADAGLEVIAHAAPEQVTALGGYLAKTAIEVKAAQSDHVLDITVDVRADGHTASVRLADEHTNVVHIAKDGVTTFEKDLGPVKAPGTPDYDCLTIEDIYDFAMTADLDDVKGILDRQIACNTAGHRRRRPEARLRREHRQDAAQGLRHLRPRPRPCPRGGRQ